MDYSGGGLYRLFSSGLTYRQLGPASFGSSMACAVDNNGNVVVARTFSYNLVLLTLAGGVNTATNLLNGGNRITVNGVGTAAYSHETYCVWIEPVSGDIIWCDYGGSDGTGTGSIRRRSATTTATSIVFNVTSPKGFAPDATGANWYVAHRSPLVRTTAC